MRNAIIDKSGNRVAVFDTLSGLEFTIARQHDASLSIRVFMQNKPVNLADYRLDDSSAALLSHEITRIRNDADDQFADSH